VTEPDPFGLQAGKRSIRDSNLTTWPHCESLLSPNTHSIPGACPKTTTFFIFRAGRTKAVITLEYLPRRSV